MLVDFTLFFSGCRPVFVLAGATVRAYSVLFFPGLANIYMLYTPRTLGLGIAVLDQGRERGRFRGSTEGARRRSKGASREQGGALSEQRGSTMGQCRVVVGGSLKWLLRSRLELPSLLFCCAYSSR